MKKSILMLGALVIMQTISAQTNIYTYDQLGRLKTIEYANGAVEEFSYDHVGNRESSMLDISALPVELTKFTAYPAPNEQLKAIIEWSTTTEINTDFFEVQHSSNGRNFREIGTVKAAGQSTVPINYQLKHHHPNHGVNYYRLVTHDIDKFTQTSQIVTVTFQENHTITLFPNPTRGITILQLNGEVKTVNDFRITNALGQSFTPRITPLEEGKWEINVTTLPLGTYQISLLVDGVQQVAKLIVGSKG